MASLKELGLKNEVGGEEVDFDNLPKVGGFAPMFQPGRYRFELPTNLSNLWETVDAGVGQRVSIVFDQNAPLRVVQAPEKYKDRVGEPFQTRVSNVERARGRDKIKVADLDYLLKALGWQKKIRHGQNIEYVNAMNTMGGKQFDATVEVQYHCSERRDKYVDDGQGGITKLEGQPGCGSRYYQNDVAQQKNEDGTYPERITCGGNDGQCGASVRGFNQFGAIG